MGQRYTIVKINTCKLAISQRLSVKDILPKQNSCNDAVMTLLCSKLGSNYKKMQKIFR